MEFNWFLLFYSLSPCLIVGSGPISLAADLLCSVWYDAIARALVCTPQVAESGLPNQQLHVAVKRQTNPMESNLFFSPHSLSPFFVRW